MNASAGIDTVKMHQLLLYVVYSFGCEGTGGRGRGLQREGCLINFLLQKGGGYLRGGLNRGYTELQ